MTVRPQDEIKVSFPAQPTFSNIGRVSVAGVAHRLAIDISLAEELRLTADAAVHSLLGLGRVTVTTQWSDIDVVIRLENPAALLDNTSELAPIHELEGSSIETIFEPPARIFLRLKRAATLTQPPETLSAEEE